MTTQIKAGVIAANAVNSSELASGALSGQNFTGDVTFDTTTLVIDSTNNRVGIGTDSPAYTLTVEADKDTWISRIYNTGSDANAQGLLVRSDATAAHDTGVLGVYADGGYKMIVRSTGNVGIGTTDIPHGNVGYAKFAIDGTNANSAGPHLQYTTSTDNYPVFQQLNWAHDNVSLNFDSYFDGSWRSSDAGSNFQIYKNVDALKIKYDSGIAAGSVITWNDGLVIDTSGNLLVNQTSAGVNGKLQVTGGIGLTGDSVIRQSTNSDGSTLRFLGTQFVAGSSNAVGYSYSSGALIASVSNSANVTLFEAGASNTSGHRLTIQNDATGLQGEVKYAGSEPVFILRDTRSAGGTAWSDSADEHLGEIQFWTSDSTGVGPHSVARIKTVNDITAASPAGRLSFFTSQYNDSGGGWEKMRIASNGTISMYSATTNTLQLNTSSSSTGTNNLIRAFSDSNISSGGTVRFVVFPSGNVQNSNNSYGAISDETKKENIVDATNKLDKLNQVRVRNFNFIGDDLKQIGVVAQELETIFPSMVEDIQDQDAEGNVLETSTKSVKYSVFVPILIKAIQEQQTIIDDLKSRLDEAGL